MTTTTPEEKARKVAEGVARRVVPPAVIFAENEEHVKHLRQLASDAITTALLQFALEQESEAVEELVVGLETALEGFRPPFAGDDTLLPIKVEKAKHLQALVARHSKKGDAHLLQQLSLPRHGLHSKRHTGIGIGADVRNL